MKRPIAAVLLTILAVIAGIIAIIDVLRYLRILPQITLPLGMLGEVNIYGGSIFGAILAGIVAIIWFWVAKGLWNLEEQAWLFVVVIAIVYLIIDVVAIIAGTPYQALLLSIVVSGLALILALLPGTQKAYGRG